MEELKQSLQNISFFAGNRFDLVQAGGGNTSVKLSEHEMLVKASGISLSEVTNESGYVSVNYQMVRDFLTNYDFTGLDKKQREKVANETMISSKFSEQGRPSIETFLHALLNTHTLHTHPISINVVACQKSWKEDLLGIWPDAICVPYHTPGIDLAIALADEMNAYTVDNGHFPKVVFLQNHGLIISSDDPHEVIDLTESVNDAVAESIGLNLDRYRSVTSLQTLLWKQGFGPVSILCNDDSVIHECISEEQADIKIWPFCPDTLIYCGVRPVFLMDLQDDESIQKYTKAFAEMPKVIILNKQVYFCANNLKKAKEAQELFKFHLMVIQNSKCRTQRLKLSEIGYLSNWDAEKFRQEV